MKIAAHGAAEGLVVPDSTGPVVLSAATRKHLAQSGHGQSGINE